MVEHCKELDSNHCCKSQNEHEANGVDLYVFSGGLEVEVEYGDRDRDGRRELEGKCCHQPQGIQHEVGKVYLCVLRNIGLI